MTSSNTIPVWALNSVLGVIHDLVTPSECSWNQISVVIDMASEVIPFAFAALQRLARWLSLRDGFRGCEEAPSRQPDASITLLHTFHWTTAWTRHGGIQIKRRGSTVVCRISILFKMTFDMYPTYLIRLYYGFSWVTECLNRTSLRLPKSHFHSLSKFFQHSPLQHVCTPGLKQRFKKSKVLEEVLFPLHTPNIHEDKKNSCIEGRALIIIILSHGFPGNALTHWRVNRWTGK